MGQELGVISSFKELGELNQDKALKMEWINGNFQSKKFHENIDFEFKFIFNVNMKVEKQENGNNRKFNFNGIKRSQKMKKK